MAETHLQISVDPPHFDAHYATLHCQAPVGEQTHRHQTGVPSKAALVQTVSDQRRQLRTRLDDRPVTVDVERTAGYDTDLPVAVVRGARTLDAFTTGEDAFEWARSRPEFETYLTALRRRPGQQALDLGVHVDGEMKRTFVGARRSGEFVATGDTAWLSDSEAALQVCRLVAALGEYDQHYHCEHATLERLVETPLAGVQPFQRRSVTWASPSPVSVR
jgi:hypothetical protein